MKNNIVIKFHCQDCNLESLDPVNFLVSRPFEELEATKAISLGEGATI